MEKKRPFRELMRNRNFLKIWGSQIASQVTLNLINFTIILRIFEMTGSTVAVSLVWFFYALPVVLLSPFAGTLVDLIDKKKLLLFTNLSEALIVLGYLAVGEKIWVFYSVIFVYALIDQLYIPTEGAALPAVVKKERLPEANTLFMFALYGSKLVGFSLAGPIVKAFGYNAPFGIGAVLLLMATTAVSFLPHFGKKIKIKINGLQTFAERLKEGYIFVRQQPGVFFPLIMLGIASIFLNVLTFLAPSYASQILQIDLWDAGLALILPAGFGAMLGARSIISLLKRVRKKKIISVGLFSAAFGMFGLAAVSFLPHWRVLAGAVVVFILGFSYSAMIIPSQTLIQEQTPEKLRGRVFGVLGLTITLASFLPVLLTATIADILGIRFIAGTLAAGIVFIGYYVSKKEPYEAFLATGHRS